MEQNEPASDRELTDVELEANFQTIRKALRFSLVTWVVLAATLLILDLPAYWSALAIVLGFVGYPFEVRMIRRNTDAQIAQYRERHGITQYPDVGI